LGDEVLGKRTTLEMGCVREKAGVKHSGWSECDCDRIFVESVAEKGKAVIKTKGQGRIN
jgi:hypothetical protein